MKLLTFVIPAYNAEAFLDKCITSMIVPQLLEKLEILVIDDGSKDQTAAVAETYCREYPGSVRLILQENRGHGGALNTGFAAATGKYVKVVDADDWVQTQNLSAFLELLARCESDVVLTHSRTIHIVTGNQAEWKSAPGGFGRAYTMAEIMAHWPQFAPCMNLHGITYRRDFYQKSRICLLEHMFYEDHEYATFPCCHAAGVTPFDLFLYEYRIGDENQSISRSNQLKRIGQIEKVLQTMMAMAGELPANSTAAAYAIEKIRVLLMRYLTVALLAEPDKKAGRQLAARQVAQCRQLAPMVWSKAERKYRILVLLNRLHVSEQAWEKVLHSRLMQRLRGKAD